MTTMTPIDDQLQRILADLLRALIEWDNAGRPHSGLHMDCCQRLVVYAERQILEQSKEKPR